MNIYFFLKKEFLEIRQYKKVIFFVLFSSVYPILLNIIASNPLMPLEKALHLSIIIIATLSGEITYILMVDEIKTGTLDILLLSKYKKTEIVYTKIILPSLIAVTASILGLLLNNISSLYSDKVLYIQGIRLIDFFLIISTSVFCSLVTIIALMYKRNANSKIVTLIILLDFVLFSALYILSFIVRVHWVVIITVLITLLVYILAVNSFKLTQEVPFKNKRKRIHFVDRDNTLLKCLIKREIIKLQDQNVLFIKYLFMVISFIIVNSRPIESSLMKQLIPLVEIYTLSTIFTLDIYFVTAKYEKYAKVDELLQVAGVSKRINYLLPLALAFVLGFIGGIIFVILNNVLINNQKFMFGFEHLITYIFTLISSELICYLFVIKHLKSIREERVIRIFIYFTCFVFFVLWNGTLIILW